MKKLSYLLLSISIVSFLACGGESHDEANHESENHEGHNHAEGEEAEEAHDHAAMEEAAEENEFFHLDETSRVFFANLENGDVVSSPLVVEMGAEGVNIHPAGELIQGTGHHHIIIDQGPVPEGTVVPADENHIHFGGGQTETELELTPGPHSLTLQLADGLHRSYGNHVSATIEIVISE